ncbi:MAG: hypothetical protein WKG00_22955 [Polyangiaceae bacterium]
MSLAVRRAPSVRACLLIAAACLGACSDTFVVGREPPGEPILCYSCHQRLFDCSTAEECPAACPEAEVEWNAYDDCICQECADECGACPATLVEDPSAGCIACRGAASSTLELCQPEWLACTEH